MRRPKDNGTMKMSDIGRNDIEVLEARDVLGVCQATLVCWLCCAVLVILAVLPSGPAMADGASHGSGNRAQARARLSDAMKPLSYLITVGDWIAGPTFYGADGAVTDHGLSTGYARPILGGAAIEQGGRLVRPFESRVIGWIVPDEDEGGFRYITYDRENGLLVHRGGIEDGKLVLTTEPIPTADGGTIIYRRTDKPIDAGRYQYRLHYSRDGGASWVLANEQINIRQSEGHGTHCVLRPDNRTC